VEVAAIIPKVISRMHLLLALLMAVLMTAGRTLALNRQPAAPVAAGADEDDVGEGQLFAYVTI
jgi:hypothetical protein